MLVYDVFVTAMTVPPIGDLNANGTVDFPDHAAFANCLAGSDAAPARCVCSNADLDADNDADLADAAVLQRAFE